MDRSITELFDLVGRRWALRLLWELRQAGSPLRFVELRARCGDMSTSVLAQRIAELRQAKLVARSIDGYVLTDLGADLVTRFATAPRLGADMGGSARGAARRVARAGSRRRS